jgi:IS1 family transposase
MLERLGIIGDMNNLPIERQIAVIASLVEGNSIRATVRMTGVAKDTVTKLLARIGQACAEFQDKALRNLTCKRIQCDEIWSFCYAKDKNVPQEKRGQFGYGDVWTWTAICADTKLIPCWRVGRRGAWDAQHFMYDVASRLANRIQLTTDGHRVYLDAVDLAFGNDIDYAMLVKLYGADKREKEARYSPAQCLGAVPTVINGRPDRKHISTSYAERQNLTMRMSMRRFTRLTNAFSKKVENHGHALALYFMYYNFCRIHQSLRVTPAMAAGVSDHVWEISEVVNLLHVASEKVA